MYNAYIVHTIYIYIYTWSYSIYDMGSAATKQHADFTGRYDSPKGVGDVRRKMDWNHQQMWVINGLSITIANNGS